MMIDLYCERISAGFWAEPFNALSNISFFVVAIVIWSLGKRLKVLSLPIKLLISLIVAIAIGSTLFHTFATNWAKLLDVLPIGLFQLAYLWIYSRRVIKLPTIRILLLVVLLLSSMIIVAHFPHLLNRSIAYAPGLSVLLGLGLYHWQQHQPERGLLLLAAGIFLVALFFRTIDQGICATFPLGTHFLWHLLNGVVLYLSMKALLKSS